MADINERLGRLQRREEFDRFGRPLRHAPVEPEVGPPVARPAGVDDRLGEVLDAVASVVRRHPGLSVMVALADGRAGRPVVRVTERDGGVETGVVVVGSSPPRVVEAVPEPAEARRVPDYGPYDGLSTPAAAPARESVPGSDPVFEPALRDGAPTRESVPGGDPVSQPARRDRDSSFGRDRESTAALDGLLARDGSLRDGEFRDGEFRDGSLRDGSLRDGDFRDGEFRDGEFRDGGFRDGSLRDGSLRGGSLRDGGFRDGEFRDGASRDGGLRDGGFRDGDFRDGDFRDRDFRDQGSREGELRDGEFRDGELRDGELRDGVLRDAGPAREDLQPGRGPARSAAANGRHAAAREQPGRAGPSWHDALWSPESRDRFRQAEQDRQGDHDEPGQAAGPISLPEDTSQVVSRLAQLLRDNPTLAASWGREAPE